jgi:hypothetical protein
MRAGVPSNRDSLARIPANGHVIRPAGEGAESLAQ